MKKCSSCKSEKPISDFSRKTGDKLHSHCKACQSKKAKLHYKKNKDKYKTKARANNKKYKERNKSYIRDYKLSKGCSFCEEKEPACLDFHHVESKRENVSKLASFSLSLENIRAEIDKCIVVCSNCHRKIHAGIIQVESKHCYSGQCQQEE